MDPKVVRPDEASQIQLYEVVFRYGAGAGDTNGRLSMLEVTIPQDTHQAAHPHPGG